MEEARKEGSHMTSAATFVESGIQDPCDDACSICFEEFCDNDPSTVTNCKHEFHLQCVLEWCQRSSKCPMCWQDISLKDPARQELLEAVERERSFRLTPARNATIFRHPTIGDFELHHLQVGMDDAELEENIIQHLAAAAAMGRTHRMTWREGSGRHPSSHVHGSSVHSAQPNGSSAGSGQESEPATATGSTPLVPTSIGNNRDTQRMSPLESNQISGSSSGSLAMPCTGGRISIDNRNPVSQSCLANEDTAGPSELHSSSDTWRSRLNSMSMKYKESIAKGAKEWKEKLLSRSSSMADIGSEVRREVNAGIANVSRMMERLETRNGSRADRAPAANNAENSSVPRRSNNDRNNPDDMSLNSNNSASFAAR